MKYEQVTDSVTLLKMNQGSNLTCIALEDELIFVDTGLNTIIAQEFRKNMEKNMHYQHRGDIRVRKVLRKLTKRFVRLIFQ